MIFVTVGTQDKPFTRLLNCFQKFRNEEDYSPLKNRIEIGSKKIKKGYQESQISKILNKII